MTLLETLNKGLVWGFMAILNESRTWLLSTIGCLCLHFLVLISAYDNGGLMIIELRVSNGYVYIKYN